MKRESAREKKPFDPADYPALGDFFPAYLHQDFGDEYGSAAAALKGFLGEASGDEILQTKEDWARFRKAFIGRPLKELQAAVNKLGGAWMPANEAELRDWDEILSRAQA